jgi:hypothetical protein
VAGYRDFQTGEVLTAANVNDFLMEQSVMTFADDAARTTALTDVLREGLLTYNLDTNALERYDGSAWVKVPDEADVDAAGGLVAVKHALFTGTQTASLAAGANVAVTSLSITHTLADAANKLIISAYIGAAANNAGWGNTGLAVADDGTLINIGDSVGTRARVTVGGPIVMAGGTERDLMVAMPAATFVYEPGDTSEHTYTVRAINMTGSTQTVYINRNQRDPGDRIFDPRATSGLVIQEIKV